MKMEFMHNDKMVISIDDDNIPRKGEKIIIDGEKYKIEEVENVVDDAMIGNYFIKKVIFKLSK